MTEEDTAPARPDRSRRFFVALALITLVGFGVRVSYVVFAKWDEPMAGDQIFYNAEANTLARGGGFVDPFARLDPTRPTVEAADHPPLTVLVLAPVSWIGDRLSPDVPDAEKSNANQHRLVMAVFGCLTVAMIGLVGRVVAGDDRVGLAAAAIAAVYPNLWVNDAHVMSETFATLAVVVALYLTYRCIRQPSWLTAGGLGVACGAAALARPELVALAPLLAVPAFVIPHWRSRQGWMRLGAAAVGTIVVIGPWVAFNMSRFERPVFLSATDGQTLLGANCDLAYEGDGVGLWHLQCLRGTDGDQSESNVYQRDAAIRYASDQGYRAPTVIAARFGRVWGVYAPTDMITYSEGEGRERWATALGVWTYFPVLALAVVGAVSMRRRLDDLWPLLMPIALVTVVAVATYGHMRFRAVAEPSLVVLTAVGALWIYGRFSSREQTERAPNEPDPDDGVAGDDGGKSRGDPVSAASH